MSFLGEEKYMGKNKPSTSQKRFYILIAIALIWVIVAFMVISISIFTMQTLDRKDELVRSKTEYEVAHHLATVLRSVTTDVIVGSYEIGGFIQGSVTSTIPQNIENTEKDDKKFFELFALLCRYIKIFLDYDTLFALAPGGVISQTFPEVPPPRFLDILHSYDSMSDVKSMDYKWPIMVHLLRPHPFFSKSDTGKWALSLRTRIFTMPSANISHYDFWGFSYVIVDVDDVLDKNHIDAITHKRGVEYIIYTQEEANDSIIPIRFSRGVEHSGETMPRSYLKKGVTLSAFESAQYWNVHVQSTATSPRLTGTVVLSVVLTVLFLSLFLFGLCAAIVFTFFREYDSRAHAPKSPPFALAVIGPCGGMERWDAAPDQMACVMEKLSALQYREMVRHKACEGEHAQPFTVTLVTRSVDAALALCRAVLAQLRRCPIDGPLRELMGEEEGRLAVACAVHWCTDANVRADSAGEGFRFEGPDVVYGSRLWLFAVPDQITISEAVREMVVGKANMEIQPLGAVFLRGVPGQQKIFSIVHTDDAGGALAKQNSAKYDFSPLSNPLGGLNCKVNDLSSPSFGSVSTSGSLATPRSGFSGAMENKGEDTGDVPVAKNLSFSRRESTGIRVPTLHLETELRENVMLETDHNLTARGETVTSPGSNREMYLDSLRYSNRDKCQKLPKRLSKHSLREGKPRTTKKSVVFNIDGDSSKDSPVRDRPDSSTKTNSQNSSHEFCLPPGDFITEVLLHPRIPVLTDTQLRNIFEQQLTTLELSYESVRIVLYYFYSSFKILLKPLDGPERANIFRRFVIAFGVPQRNTLEHLAVRCAIRYIQRLEYLRAIAWNHAQHMCLSSKSNELSPSAEEKDQKSSEGSSSVQ